MKSNLVISCTLALAFFCCEEDCEVEKDVSGNLLATDIYVDVSGDADIVIEEPEFTPPPDADSPDSIPDSWDAHVDDGAIADEYEVAEVIDDIVIDDVDEVQPDPQIQEDSEPESLEGENNGEAVLESESLEGAEEGEHEDFGDEEYSDDEDRGADFALDEEDPEQESPEGETWNGEGDEW